jgi:hypothetical protein
MFNDGRRDAAERSLMSAFVFIIVQKKGAGCFFIVAEKPKRRRRRSVFYLRPDKVFP